MSNGDQWSGAGRGDIAGRVAEILAGPDFGEALAALTALPARRAIAALSSPLCHGETEVRWRAAVGVGAVIAELAGRDRAAADNVVRRLMWNLNEESGNCAWGAAEAMAEAMGRDDGLAGTFAHMLVSYITPEGQYLEYGPLQRGAVWGIGRVAARRADLVRHAEPYLGELLGSDDAGVRGLAARALGLVGGAGSVPALEALFGDPAEYEDFVEGRVVAATVGAAARAAGERLSRAGK